MQPNVYLKIHATCCQNQWLAPFCLQIEFGTTNNHQRKATLTKDMEHGLITWGIITVKRQHNNCLLVTL